MDTPLSEAAWSVAIMQDDLMRAIAEILSDGSICGFTLEMITHPTEAGFHQETLLVSRLFSKNLPSGLTMHLSLTLFPC